MVDANEKDEALKSEGSSEKDAIKIDETSSNSLTGTEEEDDEEEEEEDDEEEPEEENVDNGENAMLIVKNEELETNKGNAVKEDAKKAEESKNSEKSCENSNEVAGSVEEEEDEEEEGEDDEGDLEEDKVNNGENAMLVVMNEEFGTNKETSVKEDAKKAEEPKNDEKSGENLNAKKGKEPKNSEKLGENSKAKKAKEPKNSEKSGENSNVKKAKKPQNSEKSGGNSNVKKAKEPNKSGENSNAKKAELQNSEKPGENSNTKKAKEPKNSEKSGENSNVKKAKAPKNSEKSGENSNAKKAKKPQNSEKSGGNSNVKKAKEPKKSGENSNAKKAEELQNSEKPGENSNTKKAKEPKNSDKSGEISNAKEANEPKNSESSGGTSNAKKATEPKNSEKSGENSNAMEAKEPKNSEKSGENSNAMEAKEPKNSEKLGENLKGKEKSRGAGDKNRKLDERKESGTLAANGDKPVSSKKKKGSKRVESMGMVFMCNSKTKADCFRYKILGLPANKKDQVLKIYKGMRLFLFDVDLRLMYGIFKAAGPGGFNIEPRAFKSEFPSQVRFTVLDDCLPLAEENFKSVLKENYYTRNKFEGLLKSDQVKKLCKLFVKASRGGGRSKSAVKVRETQLIEARRLRRDEIHRNPPDDQNTPRALETHKRRVRDEERLPHSLPIREKRRYTDYDRDHPRVLYDHEPPVPRYHPAPPPAAIGSPVRLYTYERQPLDIPPYVHDHVPEHHTYPVLDRDWSRERDPYPLYSREPPLYRDTVYPTPPDYHLVSGDYNHPPPIQTPEYHITGGPRVTNYRDVETARDYHSSALPLPEYHSTRSRYRI